MCTYIVKSFFCFLFLVLLIVVPSTRAQVQGSIKVTLLEDGGNAAAYGFVGTIGPSNRTQSFSCPRSSYGDYPSGRTICTTTYGSASSSEWQPGDTITVFSFKVGVGGIPLDVRPPDSINCSWDFKGWTGACTGMGTSGPNNRMECTIVLPMSGDVEIGALFSGSDNAGRACPALPNPSSPSPTASATPAPTGTPLPGNKLVAAINDVADELADRLRIKSFLRDVVTKVLFPKLEGPGYHLSVQVTATGEGSSRLTIGGRATQSMLRKLNKISIADSPLIAQGKIKTSSKARKVITLRSTRIGRKILVGRKSLTVTIVVTALQQKQVVEQVTVTKILTR
jgi:hypothetical protein